MRRWHQDKKITVREWRKHRQTHVESNEWRAHLRVGISSKVVDCECDEQIGRFRKKDAFDCGNPRCGICHFDKFYGRYKSPQQQLADLAFREQLDAQDEKDH